MKPEKKPAVGVLIVTPVWGAYDVVDKTVEAVDNNTNFPYYHVLVNDNYKEPLNGRIKPSKNRAIIDVYNDPPDMEHVEQIGKMVDIGLAFGRTCVNFSRLIKLESDCVVNKDWDKILLDEMPANALMIQAFSVDTKPGEQPVPPQEEKTYPKDWVEMNCCMFSPLAMNHNWQFSMVPHSVDIHLSRHLKTMSGDMPIFETTKTWMTHYRCSSRKNYDL